jgi:hypothetical protein
VNRKATLTRRRVSVGFVCTWRERCRPFVLMSFGHNFDFVLPAVLSKRRDGPSALIFYLEIKRVAGKR